MVKLEGLRLAIRAGAPNLAPSAILNLCTTVNYPDPMTHKPTRGGARPGAGRKPRDTPRDAITVRLEPEDAARLRDLCKAREVSQADWFAEKIRVAKR